MENKLQVFENEEFGQLRTVEIDGEIHFVAADVCKILELTNPTVAVERLDADEKAKFNLGLPGGETNCVNETGLYRLIFTSRKPDAKKFQRWVFHEVLPSIRKTGFYSAVGATPEEIFTNPSNIRLILDNWERDREKLLQAEKTIELQKPKVLFADAVETSKSSILVGALAKLITQNGVNIGQNSLFEWLRNNGYLIRAKNGNWNMPTQSAMNMGLFEVKESTHNNPDGSVKICKTTKVTGKGQTYFVNKFLGKNANN